MAKRWQMEFSHSSLKCVPLVETRKSRSAKEWRALKAKAAWRATRQCVVLMCKRFESKSNDEYWLLARTKLIPSAQHELVRTMAWTQNTKSDLKMLPDMCLSGFMNFCHWFFPTPRLESGWRVRKRRRATRELRNLRLARAKSSKSYDSALLRSICDFDEISISSNRCCCLLRLH